MSPIVCVLSMLFAVTLIPARAAVYAHAEITDFDIELTDLDPNDGIAPSFTLDGDVRASAGRASYPSDTYGGDSYEGTDWMAPTQLSSVNSIGTAFAEMLPGSYSAHASVNAPAGNDGDDAYTVQASVSKDSMGGLILSPHSSLTFSGTIAASIVYDSTEWYDVTASASFGILAPSSSFYQVAYYEQYKYSDWIFMPRGEDGPFSITLENTSDSQLVAQVWTSVYARATRAVTASPIPEPQPYILLLCGTGLLEAMRRRRLI